MTAVPAPLLIACANVVLDRRGRWADAVHRLDLQSDLSGVLVEIVQATGTPATLVRLAYPWRPVDYAMAIEALADVRHVPHQALSAHLAAQQATLRRRRPLSAACLLFHRIGQRTGTTPASLARLLADEAAHQRALAALGCRPATTTDLAWVLARAGAREVADDATLAPPWVAAAEADRPPVLAVVRAQPLPTPWVAIDVEREDLRLRGPHGLSHQAFLTLAAVSGGVEALDRLDVPVDLALTARPGAHGTVNLSASLAVAASDRTELAARVGAARSGTGAAPAAGQQVRAFLSHLPACGALRTRTAEQRVASTRPAVPRRSRGPSRGLCVGIEVDTGTPFVFDPVARGQTIVVAGGRPADRARCAQLLLYHAFLLGGHVYDVDPDGTGRLDHLPGTVAAVEHIDVTHLPRTAGLLDPLHIAPADARVALTYDFLRSILPAGIERACGRQIAAAIQRAAAEPDGSCATVIADLARRGVRARAAAFELQRRTSSGLARLGVASGARAASLPATRAIVSLQLSTGPEASPRVRAALVGLLAAYATTLAHQDTTRHALVALDGTDMVNNAARRSLLPAPGHGLVTALLQCASARIPPTLGELGGPTFTFESDGRGSCLVDDGTGRRARVWIDPCDPTLAAALRPPITSP